MNNNFAIYINKNDTIEEIQRIKTFILTQSPYSDIVILCDDNVSINGSFGILSSFYMKFFKGSIIFTDLQDYIEYKETSKLCQIYVIVKSAKEIVENNMLQRNSVSNTIFLTITDGEIHEI